MTRPQVSGPAGRAAGAQPAMRWLLSGVVQGVGFRPFVYRLASAHGLRGWVRNCTGRVEVVAAGNRRQLQLFEAQLISEAPPIARPCIAERDLLAGVSVTDFRILSSDTGGDADIHVPPDYFVCDDCLAELHDPGDRRYRYPFINCTQCGPRYTLIEALPYDRATTSMAGFSLCAACRREYTDMLDRRFHAEPVACPACGPRLRFRSAELTLDDSAAALAASVSALHRGGIIAVKGVGGYHLLCDAGNADAVQRLRRCKHRPHKPLALMFPVRDDLAMLRAVVEFGMDEEALLRSPQRPILLLRRRAGAALAEAIAPGLAEIGVMLPYSPLHHLLLEDFGGALVATSANISGEPVLTDAAAVEQRLASVADACLHHNRPIVRPADDPVYRSICSTPRPLRLGRGNAPLELRLPRALPRPVLALGGHTKNTICLAWDDRAVVSPHIGDMGSERSLQVFEQLCADLQSLYAVQAQVLVCDAHRGYTTSGWAHRQALDVVEVQHHAAHASALLGESGEDAGAGNLVFTWDGVGLGSDGTLWGGEALYGEPGLWQRLASWRPYRLPGGEKAGREPWRSAMAIAWELGDNRLAAGLCDAALGPDAADNGYHLLHQAWRKRLNAPVSTAVGRLFDAAAALTGVCLQASFEGQGPMYLEALAATPAEAVPLPLGERPDGVLETDWGPLFSWLGAARLPREQCAAVFHDSLAEALLQQALAVAGRRAVNAVGLCGGVFQNRRLTEACVQRLQAHGFRVLLGQRLPVNDAGLSFGQVVEFAGR
jgi:hydrogenase maturation protein HypF